MPETPSATVASQRHADPLRLAIWIGAVLLGLLIPLKILSLGYMPQDDALRHVAKVFAGKPWSEIVVMREGFGEDQHPGWHAILGAAQRTLRLDADGLLNFSVAGLFLVFWLALLNGRRRPEAVLVVFLLAAVFASNTFAREFFGRPLTLVMAVMLGLLQWWTTREKISATLLAGSVALFAFSVWVHGGWYLFGLLIAAFALAGQWRKSFWLAGCWLAGVVLGAALTGHPLGYPLETVRHLLLSFDGHPLERTLVTEFKPCLGDLDLIFIIVAALIWRRARGEWNGSVIRNPVFLLAALGWLLGLKVARFWTDWGFPAALLWLAQELEFILETRLDRRSWGGLMLVIFAGAGVFIATTRDFGGRWTSNLTAEYLSPETPGIAGWLPEKGGIVYSSDMWVFYRTFYKNPTADWRYDLAFEPGLLPPDDLAILRKIQMNWFAPVTYEPWVKKMRPADRLILLQRNLWNIPGLEWHCAAPDTWIGRLPRPKAAAGNPP